MSRRHLVLLILAALFFLHNDFWLWWRPQMVLGLPVGLLYHLSYCLLVSIAMALVLRLGRPWT